MRLVTLQSGPHLTYDRTNNTSVFSTDMEPAFNLRRKSEVALKNFTMKLKSDLIAIGIPTQRIGFSTWEQTDSKFTNYLANHTISIPIATYTPSDLQALVTRLLNRTLYGGTGLSANVRDIGAELYFSIGQLSNRVSLTIAFREANEYCAPPVADTQFSSNYTYTIAPGPPTLGTLTRTSATSTEVDGWLQTDNVFTRGSGSFELQDSSTYVVTGTWAGNPGVFTSTADFNIANLGFIVGDRFSTAKAIAGSQQIVTATVIAQGGGGGAKAVITTNDVVTAGAGFILLQNGIGMVCGLIQTQYLSDPSNILTNIEYGVAIPNKNMVTASPAIWNDIPSLYYVKRQQSGAWDSDHGGAKIGPSRNQVIIRGTLGKLLRDGTYRLHFEQRNGGVDPSTYDRAIESVDYTYGNYALVLGHCTQNGTLSKIRWCSSKINDGSTSGFYETANPDLLSRDNGLVIPRGLGSNLEFWPNAPGERAVLDLYTRENAELYGYTSILNTSDPVNSSSTLTVSFVAEDAINSQYSFGESIYVDINLPLNTYVDGQRRNVVDVIPFGNASQVNDTVIYNPPYPVFINLENKEEMTIPSLDIKLFNDQRQLVDPQVSVTLSLLFRDGE